jgi:hypothetical protein
MRVGVPITLEPGPHLISPIQLQVFSDRASQDLHLSGGKRRPLEAILVRLVAIVRASACYRARLFRRAPFGGWIPWV